MTQPLFAIMPPMKGIAGEAIVAVEESHMKMVLVGDEEEKTEVEASLGSMYEHAKAACFEAMMASVDRRGITAAGRWCVIVSPPEGWESLVADDVAEKVRADLRKNPDLHVLYVAVLVDTAKISGVYPIADLN